MAAALPPDGAALEPAVQPALLSGFSDEGVFFIYVNEDRVATIQFAWRSDGSFINQRTLTIAGQTVQGSVRIVPDADGCWARIPMETPLGPVSIVREAHAARKSSKNDVETIPLKPGTVLFENFAPALMSQAVREYDAAQGGKQTLPVFILPKIVMDATLERLDTVERSVAGRDWRFTRYLFGLPGVDLTLWVDEQGKLYFADVPAQHAAYVREGFETLLQTPESDPTLSRATFTVREERGAAAPMRDGLALATDLYIPEGEDRYPVILVRTPYKKEMVELQARYYARRGYVVAVQDCRGRFASPGAWEPFVHEPEDGFDTIEWLAVQPWSSGKVGMCGASYLAWVQWWAARERPPHLVTIIPSVSPPDPFYNMPYENGVFALSGGIGWADLLESEATADLSGATMGRLKEKNYPKLLRALPVIDLDKAVIGKENAYWRTWIAHPSNDTYWERASFLDRLSDVRIPVFHQSGWFDGDGIGTKLNYLRMVSHGHPNQKLVLGPWGHAASAHRRARDRDFGPEAIVDLQRSYLRWFDRWLKDVDNGIEREPLVSVFVMGTNKWLHGDTYPLPQTRFEKWYIASGGRANTSWGNGRLSPAPPTGSPTDGYTYDPGDPTPDPNAYEEPEDDGRVLSVEEKKRAREAYHENITRTRADILVYTSDRLRQPLTFVGPIQAVLYASSSAKDTDWFVRLMEVESNGGILQLAEGKVRARFRQSTRNPEPLESGRIDEYVIDLWHTGITIPPGNRLRVEVASASFPTYSRNLNTGGHNEVETEFLPARQTIYHDAKHASHLLLPVIPLESAPAQR